MESLYILVPAALVFCGVAIGVLLWAVNHRQFDDLDCAGRRVLFEDDMPPAPERDDA